MLYEKAGHFYEQRTREFRNYALSVCAVVHSFASFEVLTALKSMIQLLSDISVRLCVSGLRHFDGFCCFHLQCLISV